MSSRSHLPPNRLIESDNFPFEFLSLLGQKESWRKEIYRPVYHVHKWWAKRLGSVFRGLLLGGILESDAALEEVFYAKHELNHVVVFDPFMGSGTTIGEAQKLGMTALGRDINPVACEAVRVSLSPVDKQKLQLAFEEISRIVENKIRNLYLTIDSVGKSVETLYFFWVMQASCPNCKNLVDLFKNFVFARNAYPKKKPEVQVVCPTCDNIFQALYTDNNVTCPHCTNDFDIKDGNAKGSHAICSCGEKFSIVESIQRSGSPPKHRLYAKLILGQDGNKEYVAITPSDLEAYKQCEEILSKELELESIQLPKTFLEEGANTKQALNYNYNSWIDFFNARQLLGLSWLHEAILAIPSETERDMLLALFSGVLEFNNLFASYKGEGTGAVRHMFSHHILKPERMPIEANIWGTPKSSGSFSGLFKTKLLRALDYRLHPFEIGLNGKSKVYNSSPPMAQSRLIPWGEFEQGRTSLSCGDSSETALPDNSVDLVVTDPPFFDNVNYSELADFFYAWQTLFPRGFIQENGTTRHGREVQDIDPRRFSRKLKDVFSECHRILKQDGLLIFSYHHSKMEGWEALAEAIWDADLYVSHSFPVHAELPNATPKSQAKSPILIDAILVCRIRGDKQYHSHNCQEAVDTAVTTALAQLRRLVAAGFKPTDADRLVVGMSRFLVSLGDNLMGESAQRIFAENRHQLERRLLDMQLDSPELSSESKNMSNVQLKLF